MMDDRNIVFKTHNQVEASIMQSILESNGIEVYVYGESISSMYGIFSPTVGGISLGVPAEQTDKALEVLREYENEAGRDQDRPAD
jgi:hypothetical protein